jgi:hypothetical protein
MKILRLIIITGISQTLIACATPKDLDSKRDPNASVGQKSTPTAQANPAKDAGKKGTIPGLDQAQEAARAASEKEQNRREQEKMDFEKQKHSDKMALEHARNQAFAANQAELFGFLRDSSRQDQLIQLGMLATLTQMSSQMFPKTEAAQISFDEDCFAEKIVSLEAALKKAQAQIDANRNQAPKANVETAGVVEEGSSGSADETDNLDKTEHLAVINVPGFYGPMPFILQTDHIETAE